MIAKSWRNVTGRRARLAVAMALLFLASALNADAAEPEPTKHRAPNAKATTQKTKPADKTPRAEKSYDIVFEEFKLKNGLRVLLAEDHHAPTFSIAMTYNVGSRDERPGRTGFAHLFEHMLFQGSENVGKGEHFILIQNNGGSANGTTNTDRTNYFETLAGQSVGTGDLSRSRPHARAGDQPSQLRQSARDRARGAPAELRQPRVRQDL